MKTTGTTPPDLVLSNLDWVRSLASRLISDAAAADDLVQEAWLVVQGMGDQAPEGRGAKLWLGGVLRNLARSSRRRSATARARELRAASGEERDLDEAPDELIARSEMLVGVGQRVLELSDPARRVMLMRWFDGLSVGEIAAKEGIPASTVRSRLHRGLNELRQRLDREHGGDSRAWALALAPLARPERVSAATASSSSTALLSVAVTMLVAGTAVAWFASARGKELSDRPGTAFAETTASESVHGLASRHPESPGSEIAALDDASRSAIAPTSENPPTNADPAPSRPTTLSRSSLHGVVKMPDGTPLPNAGLFATPTGTPEAQRLERRLHVRTGVDGSFSLRRLDAPSYDIAVFMHEDLEIVGSHVLPVQEAFQDIVVDACLLTIKAETAEGDPVKIQRVILTYIADGDESAGSVAQTPGLDTTAVQQVLPGGVGQVVEVIGADGELYFASLAPARAHGAVELVALRDAPEFGRVTLRLAHPELPDGASLDPMSIQWNRRPVPRITDPRIASGGRVEYELGGLLPGHYMLWAHVDAARPVAVVAGPYEVQIDAGSSQPIDLEARLGGMVELAVVGAPVPEDRTLARVSWRPQGEGEWKGLRLETHEHDQRMIKDCVVVSGPPGLTLPLPEGHYDIRVTADGYTSATAAVRVLEGATERVALELIQER